MKLLQYLYYKIFKTYNRIHKIVKIARGGPRFPATFFVNIFLVSIPLWFIIKLKLLQTHLFLQFSIMLLISVLFIGLTFLIEKKVHQQSIALFKNETKTQCVVGAILVNIFIIVYPLVWGFLLK